MKSYYTKIGLAVVAVAFFATAVFAVPAWSMSESRPCIMTEDETGCDPEDETDPRKVRDANDLAEQFREQARERMEALRAKGKEHSQEVRQKSCEVRKAGLERRLNRKVASAQKHQGVFDKIYARVVSFHDTKNLNTANYDELKAKVDTAQTNASTQILALQGLDISVDCTQSNVADQLSAFKQSLGETRDALKAYRSALVEFIKAVHQSAESSSNAESQ